MCCILSSTCSVLNHIPIESIENEYELQLAQLTNEIERLFNKILSIQADSKRQNPMSEFNHPKMTIDLDYLQQPSIKQRFAIIRALARTNDVSLLQRLLCYLQSEKRFILSKQRHAIQHKKKSHQFLANFNFKHVIYFYGITSIDFAECLSNLLSKHPNDIIVCDFQISDMKFADGRKKDVLVWYNHNHPLMKILAVIKKFTTIRISSSITIHGNSITSTRQ